jgi:hypothetical protein
MIEGANGLALRRVAIGQLLSGPTRWLKHII